MSAEGIGGAPAIEEERMLWLRAVLVIHLIALVIYTAIVIDRHGWDLLTVFFGDILAFTWPGQFNVDFLGFLILSAFWTAWRGQFSPPSLLLAVVAFFGGMMFLSIYVLWLSLRAPSIEAVMLGRRLASDMRAS